MTQTSPSPLCPQDIAGARGLPAIVASRISCPGVSCECEDTLDLGMEPAHREEMQWDLGAPVPAVSLISDCAWALTSPNAQQRWTGFSFLLFHSSLLARTEPGSGYQASLGPLWVRSMELPLDVSQPRQVCACALPQGEVQEESYCRAYVNCTGCHSVTYSRGCHCVCDRRQTGDSPMSP